MSFLHLFFTFLKIGLFTIGGGYAMIPLIQEEVLQNHWLSSTDLIDFIAVSESTPGPFAVNIATYIGAETAGILGAVCATAGVVLPSFLIILLVAKWFLSMQENHFVQGALYGLRPAVVGLIAAAAFSVCTTSFFPEGSFTAVNWIGVCIFALALALLLWKKPHPILLILFSAGLGIVFCTIQERFIA